MAAVSVTLAPGPFGAGGQFFDSSGLPLNAGLINTYIAGGTTPQATYTTSAGTVQNANPIVLGADGRPPHEIWLQLGVAYRFDLTDSLSNLIGSYDNLQNSVDIAFTTVASGTSTTACDIWSPLGPISLTGTSTITGFAAAPVAGASRWIVCTGACSFTTGANLLVEGFPSGVTVTMKANADLFVIALTTTQFQIQYSLSGNFTATGTGFSAGGSATLYYKVTDGLVVVSNLSAMNGTSNATTFTITGFPAAIQPTATLNIGPLQTIDNGAYASTGFGQMSAGGTLTLYTSPLTGAWTNSGTKGVLNDCITYLMKA